MTIYKLSVHLQVTEIEFNIKFSSAVQSTPAKLEATFIFMFIDYVEAHDKSYNIVFVCEQTYTFLTLSIFLAFAEWITSVRNWPLVSAMNTQLDREAQRQSPENFP